MTYTIYNQELPFLTPPFHYEHIPARVDLGTSYSIRDSKDDPAGHASNPEDAQKVVDMLNKARK